MVNKVQSVVALMFVVSVAVISGCAGKKKTAAGVGIGAVAGATIGGLASRSAAGAVVGGLLGGVVGGAIGNSMEDDNDKK